MLELAKHNPEHIFSSGRNQKKADEIVARLKKDAPSVKATFIECDISSLQAVK